MTEPIYTKTIGILGGGQLGRMLALAAYDIGMRCVIWDPDPDAPALEVTKNGIAKAYDNKAALKEFIDKIDVAVLEFENIPCELVAEIEKVKPISPSSQTLAIVQDRFQEKSFFDDHGIPCAEWYPVDSKESAREAGKELGYPLILKTCRFGYDGKGQKKIHSDSEMIPSWEELGCKPCIAEKFIPFNKEISIIGARKKNGEFAIYDIAKNIHKDHILVASRVPADLPNELEKQAEKYLIKAMGELDINGLLALEMFVVGDKILANEMAARPHNSGHWTMAAAVNSQFNLCIAAITGHQIPLHERTHDVLMRNLLGDEINTFQPPLDFTFELSTPCYYGKKEIREGRKMGHINYLLRKKEKKEEKSGD